MSGCGRLPDLFDIGEISPWTRHGKRKDSRLLSDPAAGEDFMTGDQLAWPITSWQEAEAVEPPIPAAAGPRASSVVTQLHPPVEVDMTQAVHAS